MTILLVRAILLFAVIGCVQPLFGHTTAYGAGQVVGTLGGVAASFVAGNVAACAGKIGMVAKAYSGIDTAAGMAQTGMNLYQGNVGVSDALTFLPVAGYAANKLGILQLWCFAEDTMVLTGTMDQPGVFCEKKIQDLAIGDLVWSKDQDDPDGALELKPITNLYRSVAHDLQTLSLADEQGNVEVLLVTDEHPFYAEGQGWTGASGLYIGQYVEGSDGRRLRVVENVDYKSDEGLVVYNLEVEDGHTYFVADGQGEDSWAWVHNTCAGKHHFFPKALGNPIPYGSKHLTHLSKAEHTALHNALNKHLQTYRPVYKDRVVDMFPRRGNSGNLIQEAFSPQERIEAVQAFYRDFKGGAYNESFMAELVEALKRGIK